MRNAMRAILVAIAFVSLMVATHAQTEPVTLSTVLLFEYPGVEWVLDEPAFPEQPVISVWRDSRPKPLIADLEAKRDTPSAALLEAVRTGVFPEPSPTIPPTP